MKVRYNSSAQKQAKHYQHVNKSREADDRSLKILAFAHPTTHTKSARTGNNKDYPLRLNGDAYFQRQLFSYDDSTSINEIPTI